MKFFYTLKESALCIDEASGDLEPTGISSYYKQLMLNLALCVSVCLCVCIHMYKYVCCVKWKILNQ